jgi:hypothetical protein
MTDKDLIRDRISELQFKREDNKRTFNIIWPTLISMAALVMVAINYLSKKPSNLISVIFLAILLLSLSPLAQLLYSFVKKEDKEITKKIQKNYDLLLRKKK